jgi:hypothetical protein
MTMGARMTVADAAEVWEGAKREAERLKPELERAAEVLKQHFRKTGRTDYRGKIGYAKTTRLQLDNATVKAELGDRLGEFQRRVEIEQLSLLK